MKKFKEEFIDKIETCELDMVYPYYNNSTGEHNEVEMPDKEMWYDTEAMSINEAIDILNYLKEKGADRVYIVTDSDHHSYIFTGVKTNLVE